MHLLTQSAGHSVSWSDSKSDLHEDSLSDGQSVRLSMNEVVSYLDSQTFN